MLPDLTTENFLRLSRYSPNLFAEPFSFRLSKQCDVYVHGAGVIEIAPSVNAKSTKAVVLSCGIHGNETAPIEVLDAMLSDILAGNAEISHRCLFIFGNLAAINNSSRFLHENMNRLFSGNHANGDVVNCERKRAAFLERAVATFFNAVDSSAERLHYDLHTAIRDSEKPTFAVYPYVGERPYSSKQFGFLQALGINAFLLSNAPTTTFSYYSFAHLGAQAFTLELGKVHEFGENDPVQIKRTYDVLLALLQEDDFAPEVNTQTLELFRVNQVINRRQEDFMLHFADDVANFTRFRKGDILASETGAEYVAQYDDEGIVFPNASVQIGQRALLTIVPVNIEELHVST